MKLIKTKTISRRNRKLQKSLSFLTADEEIADALKMGVEEFSKIAANLNDGEAGEINEA